MSSLTQINTYSDIIIEYTDLRLPGIKLNFPAADDIPDFVADSTSFVVQRTFDIEEVINPNGTLNLTYTIDLSSTPGATLTWTTLFSGAITTESNQVYSVSAIESVADWELVRAPLITVPNDFQGSFEYTCALTYVAATGIQTLDWTVGTAVPVASLTSISTLTIIPNILKAPSSVSLSASTNITAIPNQIIIDQLEAGDLVQFDYIPGTTNKLLTAAPQFSVVSLTPTIFTLTITTDRETVLEAFTLSPVTTGVTFSYNDANKTATIVGSSANINTALENLQIDVRDNPIKYYWNFNLTFSVSNDQNQYTQVYTLPTISTDTTYQNISVDDSYVLNTPATIQGGPTVDPQNLLTSGTWTTTIRPLDSTQVASLTGAEISGYGPVPLQRLTTTILGNEGGRRVAISTNGQYIGDAGNNIHRIWYKDSTTWTTQTTFNNSDYIGEFLWKQNGPVFDMSDDAVYVAYGMYQGTQFEPTSFSINIHTRSGTTWTQTATIELTTPTPSFQTRPAQIKLNKTGSKLAIATADGRILIYTRSGSTWSLNSTINNVLTKTISGTDPFYDNQAYTKTAGYIFNAFDMDPSGTYFAVAMDIDSNNIPTSGDAGSSDAYQEGLYNDRVAIYNGTTFQHDFAMTNAVDNLEYPETGDDPTSVSFNDGATSLIVSNADVVYLTRNGSTWSDSARIDVAATNVNNLFTTATISHDGTIMAAAGKNDTPGADQNEPFVELWALINGTWEFQFTTSGTDQTNNLFYEMQSVLSGDGEFFGYGNLAYVSGSTYRGEVFMFTLDDFGRFETGSKELTIIADKDDTNNLIDNFTLTPATGESDSITLIYETTNPNGIISSRLQNINKD